MVKLSKSAWLAILVGVIVIAFGALGMSYSQQNGEQARLSQALSQAQLVMTKTGNTLAADKQRLDETQAKAQADQAMLLKTLSPGNESIEACDTVLLIAQANRIRVIDINSTPPARQKINGADLSALSLSVRVAGKTENILQFISDWTARNVTGVVSSTSIVRPTERRSTDNATASDNLTDNVLALQIPIEPGSLIATVNMVIYTYGK